jgi:hypothetical protein
MRKTLMLSAAAFGLAIGAPAFAQTTTGSETGTMAGQPAATAGATSGTSATAGTTAPGHTGAVHHWRHAARAGTAGSQVAQNSGQADMQNGAVRPGHVPGVGDSEPASNRASNIDRADTRSVIAPRLPAPSASANASPEQLLGVAQNALRRGQTGEAQEALERAETRALDRSTAQGNENMPAQGPFVQAIGQARRSLANHDVAQTQRDIQNAMSASSFAQNRAGASMSGSGMSGTGMSGAGMSGGMSGGYVGQSPAANSAYSGAAMAPGTNALATTGATNGNAVGASTGGPTNANGIPGTPNGISGQTGGNSGDSSGGTGGGSGSGNGGNGGTSSR